MSYRWGCRMTSRSPSRKARPKCASVPRCLELGSIPNEQGQVTMASHALYAGVLGVIVAALLTVSLSRLSKTKTKADYLLAGRSLPTFVLVFTLLSSWIGSGSLLGGAENAYNHGFAALWQAGGGWAGLLLIYFIAPRARKFAQFT